MRVRDVMSSPVVCVPPDMPLKEVADLLVRHAISAVPVVDGGELVGIVSEADLVPLELAPDPRAHLIPPAHLPGHLPKVAGQAMTREVVALPEEADAAPSVGQLPPGVSAVMYRGRAAKQLVRRARLHPWTELDRCPHENLRDPERVHIDPEGNVHLCQGISLGNVFERSLREIVRAYDPEAHPIAGPLVSGGPAGLVRRYRVAHRRRYADACHLCDETRRALRRRFPEILRPNRMYGLP